KQLREELRRTKEQYNLRIKTLTQKTRRMKKKIVSLENILEAIKQKNFLEEEQLYNLKGISIGNAHLLKRVVYKSKGKSLSQKYSPELRIFALTLHYYSPRAYSFVRETFNSCLPHPKTLYKWYCSVNGEPGFNKEALAFIKERVSKTDRSLFGALIMDEMAIRQQVEFDGQKFCGKCDMGDNIASEEHSIAKEALVFLVVGVNEMWKIPVGYFLINSITGEQKANLVMQCLSLLHNAGICIKSLTCDGAANNLSMIRLLKCNITNPKCMQGYFEHPSSSYKVHIFLDACHMLKLLRNTLGDYKCIVNSKGQMIKWDHIVALHELQQNEGLHLGNKLRQQHIQYHKKKMNVRFAAQVCSASVANAL
ncbi:THAP domain-containing protein 9, partial [Camponotus floridanus]